MLRPLETLHRPGGSLYRDYTDPAADPEGVRTPYSFGPNRVVIGGSPVDVGFSIDLTIDPDVQGKGTFFLKDIPCPTAFDLVLRTLRLRSVVYSNSLTAVEQRH